MDLAELLDDTQPVTVEFMGKKITCHVYTAGYMRLRDDERKAIEAAEGELSPIVEKMEGLESELQNLNGDSERRSGINKELKDLRHQVSEQNLILSREMIPLMIGGWDGDDGQPLVYRGEPCPPTKENISKLPIIFALKLAFHKEVNEVWSRPMAGELLASGSLPEAQPEDSPIANITDSSN